MSDRVPETFRRTASSCGFYLYALYAFTAHLIGWAEAILASDLLFVRLHTSVTYPVHTAHFPALDVEVVIECLVAVEAELPRRLHDLSVIPHLIHFLLTCGTAWLFILFNVYFRFVLLFTDVTLFHIFFLCLKIKLLSVIYIMNKKK